MLHDKFLNESLDILAEAQLLAEASFSKWKSAKILSTIINKEIKCLHVTSFSNTHKSTQDSRINFYTDNKPRNHFLG